MLSTQTHDLLFAETLLLLCQFAGFLLGLCLYLLLILFLGFLFGSTLGGFLFSLLLGFVVATLPLQLCINRLVDGLGLLAGSD